MVLKAPRLTSAFCGARQYWNSFFFGDADPRAAALFRVAFAILSLWTSFGILVNKERYYGFEGLVPWHVVADFPRSSYSLFSLAPDSELLLDVHVYGLLLASLLMLLGLGARVSSFVIFLLQVSLQHRNSFINNNGDVLFAITAFYASLMPLSHCWSIRCWWSRGKDDKEPSEAAPLWALRLAQLQIAYIYLSSFISKMRNARWLEGKALRDVLASPLYAEWPTYIDSVVLVRGLTWGTILFELAFPLFVWFRKWRLLCLTSGVLFHLGIDVLMMVPMFSAIMVVNYFCFLDTKDLEKISGLGKRGSRIPSRAVRGRR